MRYDVGRLDTKSSQHRLDRARADHGLDGEPFRREGEVVLHRLLRLVQQHDGVVLAVARLGVLVHLEGRSRKERPPRGNAAPA